MRQYSHDVFISFSFEDQKIAEDIVNILTSKYGIACWICTRDVNGGDYYKDLIPDAIEAAEVVVFIQSSHAVESEEIPKEIGIAFEVNKIIIPFRVDDAKLKGKLRYDLHGVEYIDATVPTMEQRINDLAIAIGKAIGKPISESSQKNEAVFHLHSKKPVCSQCFFGREELLTSIHQAFANGERIIFLRGMGGIGKSEIAKHYANLYSGAYQTVVFARYVDSLIKLIADDSIFTIDGISRQIKENKELQTDREYADEKVGLLRKKCGKDTLIIIDNYDVEYDPYLEELEKSGEYRLLITTRCDPKDSRYLVIPITEITDDDALKEIVINYCSKEYVNINKDDPEFEELFKLTMRHTLVLELIARYMEETLSDLSEIVELLKQYGLQQLGDTTIIRQNNSDNVYEIIKRLFGLSNLTEPERQFLRYLCLMPNTGIERKYIKRWCDKETFMCQSHLIKRSMIKYDGPSGRISMHPLIREVVMSELTPTYGACTDFLELFTNDLIDYIAWNYPITQKTIYFECCKSIQHFMPTVTRENFNLWFHMTNFSCFVDSFDNNIERVRLISQKAESIFGHDSAWMGKILHRFGWCYHAYGDYKKALSILEFEAFPVLTHYVNEAPGEYIHCCCDIAQLYFKDNCLDVAMQYLGKAIEVINNEELVSENEIVKYRSIMVYTTRALFATTCGEYEYALLYGQKAIDIANSLRNTELDRAALLFSLERIYMKIADYDQAIKHIETAIQIMKEYSGMLNALSSHGERYCLLYVDLAECFESTNNIEAAKKSIKQAYEIADKIYSKGHSMRNMIKEKYILLNK